MLKKLVLGLIGLALLLLLIAGGAVWHFTRASDAIMATTYDVPGKAVPVPWPLTEAEKDTLRAEIAARTADQAEGEAAEGAEEADPADGEAAEADGEAAEAEAPDPLDGVDLERVAMENAVRRGEHLVNARLACKECHGEDFGGRVYADIMPVFVLAGPNITTGEGGLPDDFGNEDWERIIRHGVRKDGVGSAMPSQDYQYISDREVSDVIAYARSLPPVDRASVPIQKGPVGSILIATGQVPLAPALIDHEAERPLTPPAEEVSVEFGAHLAKVCIGCHRDDYSGGPMVGGDPNWPPAANLTPHEDGLDGWTTEDFVKSFREGVRPDGSAIDEAMPWKILGGMTDTELLALATYLQSLEPRPTGT